MRKSLKIAFAALALTGGTIHVPNLNVLAIDNPTSTVVTNQWRKRSIDEVKMTLNEAVVTGNQPYVIQWGDTLATIADAIGLSVTDLANINQISNPDFIIAGSTLYFDSINQTLTMIEPNGEEFEILLVEEEVSETPLQIADGYLIDTVEEWDIVSENDDVIVEEVIEEQIEESVFEEIELVDESIVEIPSSTEHEFLNEDQAAADQAAADQAAADQAAADQAAADQAAADQAAADQAAADQAAADQAAADQVAADQAAADQAAADQVAADQAAADQAASNDPTVSGTAITVEATAYSRNQAELSNFTADGTDLRNETAVIAVDPSVIPLGTTVYIPGFGYYRAADTGGAIVGNRIDIHMEDLSSAYQFGRQSLTVYIVN